VAVGLGEGVGVTVGDRAGVEVGEGDGVGVDVGLAVGVGVEVGDRVGDDDRTCVGSGEGSWNDGSSVGGVSAALAGRSVGAGVGLGL
jgi:hypothetical protein